MTVPVQTTFTASIANGATTVFPYQFKIADEADLAVTVDGVLQESGYTVSGVGEASGGDVTFSVAPSNGAKVLRFLKPVMWRETDYQQFGDWLASVVNLEFDRVWLALQTLQQNDLRSLKLPVDTTVDQVLTQDAAARANKGVKFDADGNLTISTYDPDAAQASSASNASAAAASAVAAAASEAAAAALADSFDDRYLGAKSSAPTLDNDGNPLQDGALYYDTTLNLLRVYDLGTTTWISLPVTLLSSLTDVTLTSLATGDMLTWDGAKWINRPAASQAEMEAGTEAGLRSMSPLRIAQAIAALGSAGTDQIARDQIAATNLRLMLSTAISTGALVQGKQWELSSDEWAASSTNEAYTSSTPSYYTGNAQLQVSQGAGTAFGNMTSNGGLAAAFDGNTSQSTAQSANGSNPAYVGKDWGSGSGKKISGIKVWAPNTIGIYSGSGSPATITLYGKGTLPASATDGTSLGTATINDSANATCVALSGFTTTTAYRYHWITVNPGAGTTSLAEVQFFESTAADMTLIPPAAVFVSSAPTYMDAYFLWKDDSGSAVLGTDLTVELSRDNGTTYTTATLTNLASYDGTYSIVKARANVSSQPSGTSLLCRIKTLNSKAQRVAAPALYAE